MLTKYLCGNTLIFGRNQLLIFRCTNVHPGRMLAGQIGMSQNEHTTYPLVRFVSTYKYSNPRKPDTRVPETSEIWILCLVFRGLLKT